jgi:hypothetical protein
MALSSARRTIPRILPALLLLLAATSVHANFSGFQPMGAADVRENDADPAPRVNAARVNGEGVHIDGRLDDEVWTRATPAGGFRCWSPDRGKDASSQTVFKVAYDEEAVYFAVACLEDDPTSIARSLSRRDNLRDSDRVSVYLDPYHDRNSGYLFRVTPDGVQQDSYLFNDVDSDSDWDAVWEAETSRDGDGWYAEMRIPLSSIRYRSGDDTTWGLQVLRYQHRRGEESGWTVWDESTHGFVSRFGTLDGLTHLSAPRQLEVLPYVVQRTTDPSIEGPDDELDEFTNFGLDLKYGVTSDLTLNATFQPDFGQVEADPATLNLSPFETFFEEKRPFFLEGSNNFRSLQFNLFYSRRIGTGNENSRIRAAGKLTGKTAGDFDLAALYAVTDQTQPGQTHNFLKSGDRTSHYFVSRFGRSFADGDHVVHVMQTAAIRTAERTSANQRGRDYRDGFSTGIDFDSYFGNRTWNLFGAFVGTLVDPAEVTGQPEVDHAPLHGTGGDLNFAKHGGHWRGNMNARWESDRLDPNDLGFLSAPNEASTSLWVQYRYLPGQEPRLNRGNLNFNLWRGWIYAGRGVQDDAGDTLWEYADGHPQNLGGNINGSMQFRNYWSTWFGLRHEAERTDQFITRGGPLMTRPSESGAWIGLESDGRKRLSAWTEFNYVSDAAGGLFAEGDVGLNWNASSRLELSTSLEYWTREERADYLDTVSRSVPTEGIGGESYVFGDLEQDTLEMTLRSNVLFNRDQSLELYLQPFLTVGNYTNARELLEPDTYELADYAVDGLRAEDFDFRFAAVNMNLVYRYQYRPGSTFYLVWTHSRAEFEERAGAGPDGRFRNDLSSGDLFSNEPENTFLAKLTYWFSL